MKAFGWYLPLGAVIGFGLSAAAVHGAYHDDMVPAVVLLACQAVVFVVFVAALVKYRSRSRTPSNS